MGLPSQRLVFAATALSVIASLLSCRESTPARPIPDTAQPSPVQKEIASAIAPIRIIARPGSWPGGKAIELKITPVHLKIDNRSARPLLIRYSDFRVITHRGDEFSTLPLFAIETPDRGPVVPGALPILTPVAYPPIEDPEFEFRDFRVAPHLKQIYPRVPAHEGPFPYDQAYSLRHSSSWQGTDLPNLEMIRRALPEGVLHPGGWVAGWLYFQKFEPLLTGNLVVSLTDTSGRVLAPVQIPIYAR